MKLISPKLLKEHIIWIVLRIFMAWIFLWPFFDKLFGFGLSTTSENAWIAGGSPTSGFLSFATSGPFSEVFQSLAGSVFIDWVFMIGLLLIGLALLLGIGIKPAVISGSILLFLMWLAVLPPEHNPFLDEHLIYIIILIGIGIAKGGDYFGFGKWWSQTNIIKKYPNLK